MSGGRAGAGPGKPSEASLGPGGRREQPGCPRGWSMVGALSEECSALGLGGFRSALGDSGGAGPLMKAGNRRGR